MPDALSAALIEALRACTVSTEATAPAPVVVEARVGADGVEEVLVSGAEPAAHDCVVAAVTQASPPGAGTWQIVVPADPAAPIEADRTSTCPPPPGSFPAADWPRAAIAAEAVAALDAHLFPADLDRADPMRAGPRTDGVVIVHRGEIVYERYAPGEGAQVPHLAWSVTKSFTNALAGVAVREGRLQLDDTVCERLSGTAGDACDVRVVDLLEFASGFDWRETYEGESPTSSSVLAMLYGEGSGDMARFVAGHPRKHPPGLSWRYSSGDSTLLAAIVGQALAPDHGERFPWAVLFDPIGVTSATWERDRAGTYVGSSYLWATAPDLARFGQLLLADGCWDGQRLLPEGWVAASTAVSPAIRGPTVYGLDPGDVQGRQFWLNRPLPEHGQDGPKWPSVPETAFAAQGHWGQSITVVPTHDLVVVRTADDRDRSYDHDRTLALALALVEGR